MKTKEMFISKKNNDLHIRLSKQDYLALKYLSYSIGMDISSYTRMLINTATISVNKKILNGELTYDYIETFFNDQLQQRKILKG